MFLNSDSWRIMIEDCPFEYLTPHCQQGVFLNGALHWILGSITGCMIIAFDIGTEKYSFELKPPHNLSQMRGSRVLQLDVFGECLFLSCKDESPHHLDAWVMNGYGAEGLWIHLFSININHKVTRLVAYLKNKKQSIGVHGLFGDYKLCAQHFIGSLVRLHDRCGSVADKRRMRKSKGKMKMEMVDTE
ncbi:hypothetical protein CASFOL_035059 [Castilleja foliolosa]|uniref:F-box associated beta-propeller type 1 domain-containing protein n=1 Tax=Castilleja foliolosa TaxID=1961234 RepID=A0ABD3BTV6_9LAMI